MIRAGRRAETKKRDKKCGAMWEGLSFRIEMPGKVSLRSESRPEWTGDSKPSNV